MSGPLTVRLKTSRADRHVTRQVRSLSFRKTAPGGFASAQLTLDRPLGIDPDDVRMFGKLFVYDGRYGGLGDAIWEGHVEDLGRGADERGEVWTITAIGPAARAADDEDAYVPIDARLETFFRSSFNVRSAETNIGGEDTPKLEIGVARGVSVSTSWRGDFISHAIKEAGMTLGRVACTWDAEMTDADWVLSLTVRTDSGGGTLVDTDTANTAGGTLSAVKGGGATPIPAGSNVLSFRLDRNSTSTVADDATAVTAWNMVQRAVLYTKAGVEIGSGYANNYVLASEIVEDLLGRFLTGIYDGANATVTATTFQIDQLAYPDGATPAQVLDDLMQIEPDFYWAAWESNAAGLHRFEWKRWPTTVRYEATAKDGLDLPASGDDMYNRVVVRWKDARGRTRTTRQSQTVQALDDAGITRRKRINLGDEAASSTLATQVATKFLLEHSLPTGSGTLTIARPIMDLTTGRLVNPWEILPGELIRVRNISPSASALAATARDGISVFKVLAVDYDQPTRQARLELDTQPRHLAAQIANLHRRIERRRRR